MRKTAIILIEFQNDFTSQGGIFHQGVEACMQKTNMLENTKNLVNYARNNHIQIIHSPITFSENYREIRQPTYGVLQNIVNNKAFLKNNWGGEIVKELLPHKEDIVIEGKRGLDAFYSTNLDFILRQLTIEAVVICGFLTNCCVESTVRTAYEKGYDVTTIGDCCSAFGIEAHHNALNNDLPLFSHVMNHQDWIKNS